MPWLNKYLLAPKALRQLGARPLFFYARYQCKLRSGILRLQTPSKRKPKRLALPSATVIHPADSEKIKSLLGDKQTQLFSEANEILNGQVRLFGGEPRALEFKQPGNLKHWTAYEHSLPSSADIKPVWEVGRLGWATTLARDFWLSRQERYAEGFWRLTEQFFAANPTNMGPQWSSGQEVALRLIALAFCGSVLVDAAASTQPRKQWLAERLADHAKRIIPTLDYARAQNNNHLLSEAAGLYTAAVFLPAHPSAESWKKIGWKLFAEGVESQIHEDGSYAQHSSNYHRLMLQLAVWFIQMAILQNDSLPLGIMKKLSSSVDWLCNLLDAETGQVPNLGPNDGAYVLPLTVSPFEDYRPALQAAGLVLHQERCFDSGLWDEMALWLGLKAEERTATSKRTAQPIRIEGKDAWAYLRAVQFAERPGHADQLHVDLWWHGHNIATDAGSYLYTAAVPWDNALARTRVHNTVMVESQEQMTRAGRFLWLDWAQAKLVATEVADDGRLTAASAAHEGYVRLGVHHRREVRVNTGGYWVVTDNLLPTRGKLRTINARLHWLLPDWNWQFENGELHLESPEGTIGLLIETSVGDLAEFRLIRAGELVHGKGERDPILGWRSPTYGNKLPALSLCVDVRGDLPITIKSTFTFPKNA